MIKTQVEKFVLHMKGNLERLESKREGQRRTGTYDSKAKHEIVKRGLRSSCPSTKNP